MSTATSIEWTDTTWNPVRGCALVSEGCRNCYAMKQAHRFSGPGKPYAGLTELGPAGPRWTGQARTVPGALLEPLSWRKPRRVFVNSMSDLFHEDVPDEFIDQVFAVMRGTPRHTFQILTKRPERMRAYFDRMDLERIDDAAEDFCCEHGWCHLHDDRSWPLSNVWLGVSVESNKHRDRIDSLRQVPAAVRFLSLEPLLGPIERLDLGRIDWVIVGGESGPGARPCDVSWVRWILGQCRAAAEPVFAKQLGARPYETNAAFASPLRRVRKADGNYWLTLTDRKGGDMAEWPPDLRAREFPAVRP